MMKTFHKSQVFRPQKRVNQIKGECDGHDACQYEIEIHGLLLQMRSQKIA